MPINKNCDEAIRSIERRLRRRLNTEEQLIALGAFTKGRAAEAKEICRRIQKLADP